MSFGSFIRKSRRNAGYTQRDISEKFGWTSGQFISNIERGVSLLPPEHWKKISKLYKIDPEEILIAAMKYMEKDLRKKAGLVEQSK